MLFGMDTNELYRLLLNLIRLGTIAAIHPARARCQVSTGELMTPWLPWLTGAAGTTCTWQPPTVGEQVLLLCPGGEIAMGVVLRGLYSDAYPAPSTDPNTQLTAYPEGARIAYHTATRQLSATGLQQITLEAAQSVTFDCVQTVLTGDVRIQGTLTVEQALTSQGITLHTHQHGGVKAGGECTGGPQ